MIWRKRIAACKIQCQLPSRAWLKLQWSHQDIKVILFHGPRRDPVRIYGNQYMCGAMWGVERSLAMVSLNIYKTTQMNERRKVWKKITGLKFKIQTENRGQSISKSIGTLTMLRCLFGPNLEILTSISGDLPRGQTHKLKMAKFCRWHLTLNVKVNHRQKQ